MLHAGYPLSAVTEALCRRWDLGVRLLPMTDERVETHVAIEDPDQPSGQRVVHFQEYWVRLQAAVPARAVVAVGVDKAHPAPGVVEAIRDAHVVVVPPSNPVVSVGTILGVTGIRDALRETSAPVVGLSPIVAGRHVRGMAEQLLAAVGVEVSAAGVGEHYAARSRGGVLDGWLVDTADAPSVDRLAAAGLRAAAVPLMMTDHEATADMAQAALMLVGEGPPSAGPPR
jgi:LPPG:FO 2-phospho-L-lactate transferase